MQNPIIIRIMPPTILLTLSFFLFTACQSSPQPSNDTSKEYDRAHHKPLDKPEAEDQAIPVGLAKPLPGLKHTLHVTSTVYTGSEPNSPQSFRTLAALGIKTIISVDGTKPNIDLAAEHNMTYVHIPISYNRIPEPQLLALTHAARTLPQPIYIHCHQGKHRGPTAAAIYLIAQNQISPTDARSILIAAGTSPNYPGLWESAENFTPPPPAVPLPPLTDYTPPSTIVHTMTRLDRHIDALEQIQNNNWSPTDKHPDAEPAHQALQVRELLRELARTNPSSNHRYNDLLSHSQQLATDLENALRPLNASRATDALTQLSTACTSCHQRFRN
ncbi:phosphatase domain-containing protein [Poriferisphaera sp. WC338]|uniref:phosphatase domain-containing protein n=1 Tax=Poriferisphaera sp. WC338 TaxID=3425129 RepID=UPI003D818BB7